MVLDNKLVKKLHKATELKLSGENDKAIVVLERLLQERPYLPAVLSPLAELYMAKMLHSKAADMYERISQVEDEEDLDAFFYVNYANSLKLSGKYTEAEPKFKRAYELLPTNSAILIEYAKYHFDYRHFEEATSLYEQALELDKNNIIALMNMAILFSEKNNFEEAEILIKRTLSIQANDANALATWAQICISAKKYETAEEILIKAISLYPEMVVLHINQALVYLRTNRLEQALENYNRILQINNEVKMAKVAKAYVLTQLNRFDDALREYDNILKVGADDDILYKKSMVELQMGYFHTGWGNHEARLNLEKYIYYTPASETMGNRWHRRNTNDDKSLLVFGEQGLGDVIQMSRYVKALKDEGMNVTFQVNTNLFPLFKAMPEIASTVVQERPVKYNQYVSIMSLPYEFDTDLNSIPELPKVDLPESDMLRWRDELGEKTVQRIGIVNSGNPKHLNDFNRSVNIKDLLQALPLESEYYLLHKDVRKDDLEYIHSAICKHKVFVLNEKINHFIDTACLCELMDIVIGVDTSVIHLAGTLGKKTILLLPYVPDWRWMLEGEQTPWYPSMTLLRQSEYGSWQNVWNKLSQYI